MDWIRRMKVRSHMRRTWAGAGGKFTSTQIITCVRTCARSRSGGGAGAKTALQEMGPTPNLLCPLRNHVLQTIIVLKKWQIRPRPLRACVNIPAVAEREYQNPPASAPQPLRTCVNVAWEFKYSYATGIAAAQAAVCYILQVWYLSCWSSGGIQNVFVSVGEHIVLVSRERWQSWRPQLSQ